MTLGSHQTTIGKSQDHITPRWIITRLGPFTTDPCAADPRPWDCAEHNITEAQDGLRRLWCGYTWLNPPFDQRVVGRWIERLASTGTASRCCMPAPKRGGSRRVGGTRRGSCSWPRVSSSAGPTGASSPTIPVPPPCSSPSASTPSRGWRRAAFKASW
jgi:hypothetical protein